MTDLKSFNNKPPLLCYMSFPVTSSDYVVPWRGVYNKKTRVCTEPVLAGYRLNQNWEEKPSSLTSRQETPLGTVPLCCTKDRGLQYPACQASGPGGFYRGDNPSASQSCPVYVYLEENVFSVKWDWVRLCFILPLHVLVHKANPNTLQTHHRVGRHPKTLQFPNPDAPGVCTYLHI